MRASLAFATGSLLPPGIAIVDQAVRYHLFVLSDEQPVMFGAPFVDVLSLLAMAAWFGMASVSFLASREYASYARGGAPQEPRSTRLCLLAGIAQGMSL
ncbi:MAG: hypothetical protein KDE27_10275, partial [Planctomycetes bacterium]|nr:hypothetical protein [Planctomycetota bacterium]